MARAAWFVSLVGLALLAACASGTVTRSAPPLPPGPSPTLKPPLLGLLDMGDISFYKSPSPAPSPPFTLANVAKYPGSFGGVVINDSWALLQPVDAPVLVTPNGIDRALLQIRGYNLTHPLAPLYAKLRVWAGNDAPAWAKQVGGAPVTIVDPTKGTLVFGRWWTPAYIAKWRSFQYLLAQRYDSEQLIRVVAVTSCASLTDEPFVGEFEPPGTTPLQDAGYTDAAQEACLQGATSDYAPWATTRIDYTFNLFHDVVFASPSPGPQRRLARRSAAPHGTSPADPHVTTMVMQQCRRTLGPQCILNQHALQCPPPSGDFFIYTNAVALQGPINYQTASPGVLSGQYLLAVQTGAYYGASAIELWPSGYTTLSQPEVAQLAATLENGVTNPPACPLVSPSPSPSPSP